MSREKALELLEEIRDKWSEDIKRGEPKALLDFAIDELKNQPELKSETRKAFDRYQDFVFSFLRYLQERGDIKGTGDTSEDIKQKIFDIIDRQARENKELRKMLANCSCTNSVDNERMLLLEQNKELQTRINKLYANYKDFEAQIDEIGKLKEQVSYWQQVCKEKGIEIIDKSPGPEN